MNAFFHSNARRLALALGLSALLHLLLLWPPGMSLPHIRAPAPLITVRMEPAPSQPPMPAAPEAKPKVVPARPPEQALPKPAVPQVSLADGASAVPASAAVAQISAPASDAQAAPGGEPPLNRSKDNISALPLHAQLRFAVYLDGSRWSLGDLFQELDIDGERYTLHAELEKAGLASWFNSTQLAQISRGRLSAAGDLVPEAFSEEASNAQGAHHRYQAAFDWNAARLRFADGTGSPVSPGTQDMLSLLYQLSQYSFRAEKIALAVTDGAKLEQVRFEVGETAEISTPMGTLRALHLHQLREPGGAGMEIWLGADYRMLPVRYQKIQPAGRISEEGIIQEIRVSDEQPTK